MHVARESSESAYSVEITDSPAVLFTELRRSRLVCESRTTIGGFHYVRAKERERGCATIMVRRFAGLGRENSAPLFRWIFMRGLSRSFVLGCNAKRGKTRVCPSPLPLVSLILSKRTNARMSMHSKVSPGFSVGDSRAILERYDDSRKRREKDENEEEEIWETRRSWCGYARRRVACN